MVFKNNGTMVTLQRKDTVPILQFLEMTFTSLLLHFKYFIAQIIKFI